MDIMDTLPGTWEHVGGGFTKFIPYYLTMEETFMGPEETIHLVHEYLQSAFNSLRELGMIHRFLIVMEHWHGGYSEDVISMVNEMMMRDNDDVSVSTKL